MVLFLYQLWYNCYQLLLEWFHQLMIISAMLGKLAIYQGSWRLCSRNGRLVNSKSLSFHHLTFLWRTHYSQKKKKQLPYTSKFSRRTLFADCYFQTVCGNNFRGSKVSSIYTVLKICELKFRGLLGIRENYVPRKIGTYTVLQWWKLWSITPPPAICIPSHNHTA